MVQIESLLTELCALQVIVHGLGTVRVGLSLTLDPNRGGAVAEWVRASTGDRTVDGSCPTSVTTFLFGTLAILFTPNETVKAVGPFYLVSMPGEVKDPTSPHGNV